MVGVGSGSVDVGGAWGMSAWRGQQRSCAARHLFWLVVRCAPWLPGMRVVVWELVMCCGGGLCVCVLEEKGVGRHECHWPPPGHSSPGRPPKHPGGCCTAQATRACTTGSRRGREDGHRSRIEASSASLELACHRLCCSQAASAAGFQQLHFALSNAPTQRSPPTHPLYTAAAPAGRRRHPCLGFAAPRPPPHPQDASIQSSASLPSS